MRCPCSLALLLNNLLSGLGTSAVQNPCNFRYVYGCGHPGGEKGNPFCFFPFLELGLDFIAEFKILPLRLPLGYKS